MCRQWAELVHSPALLASLDVAIGPAYAERLLHRLRSLVEWAARRAVGHVQRLRLELAACEPEDAGGGPAFTAEEKPVALVALVSALALLSSSLRHLSLTARRLQLPPLDLWTAPLTRLSSLEVGCNARYLTVGGSMRCLTALQRLRLKAADGEVELRPEAVLPPALTSLWMQSFVGDVPPQVRLACAGSPLPLLRRSAAAAPFGRCHLLP